MNDKSLHKVFLCHNSEDKPIVRAVASGLKAANIPVWIDEADLRPGFDWECLIREEIAISPSVLVFIGALGLGPYQKIEIHGFLERLAIEDYPVIPVLLPGISKIIDNSDENYLDLDARLKGKLTRNTWVALDSPESLSQIIVGITGKQPPEKTAKLAQLLFSKYCEKDKKEYLEKTIADIKQDLLKRQGEYQTISRRLVQIDKEIEDIESILIKDASHAIQTLHRKVSSRKKAIIKSSQMHVYKTFPELEKCMANDSFKNILFEFNSLAEDIVDATILCITLPKKGVSKYYEYVFREDVSEILRGPLAEYMTYAVSKIIVEFAGNSDELKALLEENRVLLQGHLLRS
jgi:hypothetical protein